MTKDLIAEPIRAAVDAFIFQCVSLLMTLQNMLVQLETRVDIDSQDKQKMIAEIWRQIADVEEQLVELEDIIRD